MCLFFYESSALMTHCQYWSIVFQSDYFIIVWFSTVFFIFTKKKKNNYKKFKGASYNYQTMVHLSCSSDAETAFVTPGDTISVSTLHVDGKKQPELHVGPGLRVITSAKKSEANDVTVQVVVAGDLRRKGNTVWVDGIHKRVNFR